MRWLPAARRKSTLKFDSLLRSADKMLLYKYIVKNVANRNGKTVTFMPKPIFGDNGSGMHTHQSLWKGRAAVCRRWYAGTVAARAVVHRWTASSTGRRSRRSLRRPQTRISAWCRIRSTGESGVFAAEPLGGMPHSDVLGGARGRSASSSVLPTQAAILIWRSLPC